jgi:hypothetical protein
LLGTKRFEDFCRLHSDKIRAGRYGQYRAGNYVKNINPCEYLTICIPLSEIPEMIG